MGIADSAGMSRRIHYYPKCIFPPVWILKIHDKPRMPPYKTPINWYFGPLAKRARKIPTRGRPRGAGARQLRSVLQGVPFGVYGVGNWLGIEGWG